MNVIEYSNIKSETDLKSKLEKAIWFQNKTKIRPRRSKFHDWKKGKWAYMKKRVPWQTTNSKMLLDILLTIRAMLTQNERKSFTTVLFVTKQRARLSG